jgi:hypothetical protein
VTDYLDRGGRIFTTDFQYTWYRYSPDPQLRGIGTIQGGAPAADSWFNLNTGTPKGAALARWLVTVFPTTSSYGQVTCDRAFDNVTSLSTKATTYATSAPGPDPRVFTVNTPAGLSPAQQCGKGVHIDAHVDVNLTDTVGCALDDGGTNQCYPATCTNPLSQGEALFAFLFFDLASCIQDEPPPPVPPPPPPPPR